MTTQLTIPAGPKDLTAEWLTDALRSTGTIKQASVTSFESSTIGEGVGVLGQLERVGLQYDQAEPGAPERLIAKFPAASAENRELGKLFCFYERENRFYEQLAEQVSLRTARCYYSAMNPEAAEHVLLLEDLAASARMGDQVGGCSIEDAELVVRLLAGFHASWWESPRLAELGWVPFSDDPIVTQPTEASYAQAWEPFVQKFGNRLPKDVLHTGEQLGQKIATILGQVNQPPKTIMHGDYRLDNMFFGIDGPETVAIIDWQIMIRGRGAYDIGYFMSQSVNAPERKAHEMDILRLYHDTLLKNGVTGYDFDQCFEDYRLATLFCLVYPVISGGQLDLANERGVALVTAMMERSVSAIMDLNAAELLPA